MRTSGRGSSEIFMFLAPAAIFGGFFVGLFGDPYALLVKVDRTLLHAGHATVAWLTALIS